ncbi:Matrix metalloproteinase-15 [Nymphon striatum]|nr:Matrix metalloproteinase-15 [Nymphon striatum]
MYCLLFAVSFSILVGTSAVPVKSDDLDDITAQKYLKQFGYMKKTPYNQQLVTGDHWTKQFSQSLKQFQRFAGLPVTGKLDDETKKTMILPRCGVSDEEPLQGEERKRKKRYALQGSRWRTGELTFGISKYPSGSSYLSKLSKKVVDKVIKESLEVLPNYFSHVFGFYT